MIAPDGLPLPPFRTLPPEVRRQRTIDGTARAAAQLGLTVEVMEAIIDGPPRPLSLALPPRPRRCHSCGQPLPDSAKG